MQLAVEMRAEEAVEAGTSVPPIRISIQYGPVHCIVKGDPASLTILERALLFDPEEGTMLRRNMFPSGLLPYVRGQLEQLSVPHEVVEQPESPALDSTEVRPDLLDDITLRTDQMMLIRKALYHRRGLIDSPCGSGKTEMAAAVCKQLGKQALVLVPGKGSMRQTWTRFQRRGLQSVGRFGDGFRELTAQVVVAVVNSVYKGITKQKSDVLALMHRTDILIFQEVHHLGAQMWRTIAENCAAPYRLGLSATVYEAGSEPTRPRDRQLEGCTGPLIGRLPDWLLMNKGLMATPVVHMLDMWEPLTGGSDWNWIQRYCIVENEHRNNRLLDVMCPLVHEGYRALGLVVVIKHGAAIAAEASRRLNPMEVQFYCGNSQLDTFRNGQQIGREKLEVDALVERLDRQSEFCLFGSPAVKEDLDFPAANVLVNFSALRNRRTTVQRTGRVLRAKGGNNIAHVVDTWDMMSEVLLNQSNERRWIYEQRYHGANRFSVNRHQNPEDVVRMILAS